MGQQAAPCSLWETPKVGTGCSAGSSGWARGQPAHPGSACELGAAANCGRHGTARTYADGRPAGDSEASGCAGFFSEGHAKTSAYRPSHALSYLSSKGPPQEDGVLSSRGPPLGQGTPGGGLPGSGTTAVGGRVPVGGATWFRDHCCGRQGTCGRGCLARGPLPACTLMPALRSISRVGLTSACSWSSTPVRHSSSISRSRLSTTAATLSVRSWRLSLAWL